MDKVTNKTINIKTYEQAAQYLLQMFSDGMLSFEDYSTQLDKLGNMYLKRVDAPNLITRMITTFTRRGQQGEEILVSFDDEVKVIDRDELMLQIDHAHYVRRGISLYEITQAIICLNFWIEQKNALSWKIIILQLSMTWQKHQKLSVNKVS